MRLALVEVQRPVDNQVAIPPSLGIPWLPERVDPLIGENTGFRRPDPADEASH